MDMHHQNRLWRRSGCGNRLKVKPVHGALRSPDRAPSPTCPFIKNQQCQRASNNIKRDSCHSPDLHRGAGCPSLLATNAAPGRNRQRRVGESHLGAVLDSVNAFLKLCCPFVKKPRNPSPPNTKPRKHHNTTCGTTQPQPTRNRPITPANTPSHTRFHHRIKHRILAFITNRQ